MSSSSAIVCWPIDLKSDGFFYGWMYPLITVAGVLQATSKSEAQARFQGILHSEDWSSFSHSWGPKPVIIGRCTFDHVAGKDQVPNVLLDVSVEDDRGSPSYCLEAVNILYYYRHSTNSMRFYSLGMVQLDLMKKAKENTSIPSLFYSVHHDSSLFHTPVSYFDSIVVNQLNSAQVLENIIQNHSKPGRLLLSSPVVYFCRSIISTALHYTYPLCCMVSNMCNISIAQFSSMTLKDLCVTAEQIDIRASQLISLSRYTDSNLPSQYIAFHNSIWLILNDIIIGKAFGVFLCENHIVIARNLNFVIEEIFINWVQHALFWLNDWPAGLKLNTELSGFYSSTFIDLIVIWGKLLRVCGWHLPAIIYLIGSMGAYGITMAISPLLDLLGFLTVHINVCYFISNVIYYRLLRMLGSLWYLFRGKRYNALRNRVDSWDYDIDQRLFGTILFTLVAFLFPTVLVYYAFFAAMRLGIIVIHGTMNTFLTLINHFPLFMVMLRIKDPWRLPDGVHFASLSSLHALEHHSFIVMNRPMAFSSIFFQYARLWSRLSIYYHPIRLLKIIFSGLYLVAIPRDSLRYNELPFNTQENENSCTGSECSGNSRIDEMQGL